VEALADSVQVPGPRSGTSTDSKPGPSVPESAPLSAFAFDIGVTRLTLVVVTLEKLLATDNVVTVVATVTTRGSVDGVVVGLVGCVVGTRVVAGDVEEGGGDEASGARGADADVRVKTRMMSRSGLDHINRCALFSEKGERGIIFEG
jgi:hypothetical protein